MARGECYPWFRLRSQDIGLRKVLVKTAFKGFLDKSICDASFARRILFSFVTPFTEVLLDRNGPLPFPHTTTLWRRNLKRWLEKNNCKVINIVESCSHRRPGFVWWLNWFKRYTTFGQTNDDSLLPLAPTQVGTDRQYPCMQMTPKYSNLIFQGVDSWQKERYELWLTVLLHNTPC